MELATVAAALYGTAENLSSFLLVSSLRLPAVRSHRVRLATAFSDLSVNVLRAMDWAQLESNYDTLSPT